MDKKEKKQLNSRSRLLIILCCVTVALLLIPGIDTVIGYLQQQSSLTNVVTMGKTDVSITENFDGSVKTDVAVKNSGNIPVYVRVAVTYAWQNASGEIILGVPQETTDYTVTFATLGEAGDWFVLDGYYYYKHPVAEGASTGNLIEECRQVSYLDGRRLVVDIVCQSIQADPAEAVTASWSGITVVNGELMAAVP